MQATTDAILLRRWSGNTARSSASQHSVKVWVDDFEAGEHATSAGPFVLVRMHLGRAVDIRCSRGGVSFTGRQVAGDLEVAPAWSSCVWQAGRSGTRLIMRIPEGLLRSVAGELGMNVDAIEVANRFQFRDPVIEHIAWAMKADLDARTVGHWLRDNLGAALAARLLQRHGSRSLPVCGMQGGLSVENIKQVLTYIDDNLSGKVSLAKIAGAAGVSSSYLQALFRKTMGASIHQYVLKRRIENAQLLLLSGDLSISQVAVTCGFVHQSHLARHMRRILGCTPTSIRKNGR